MAEDINVFFKHGQFADLPAIRDAKTFYYTDDTRQLQIGLIPLSNASDVEAAVARIAQNESDIASLQNLVSTLNADATVNGSVRNLIVSAVNAISSSLSAVATSGNASDVTIADDAGHFTANNVEEALAELASAVSSSGAVSVTVAAEPTEGYLKTYNINQNGVVVGSIDIPKDLVITSGSAVQASVENPITVNGTIYTSGTFLRLVIANQTDPVYINASDLVDVYTVTQNATQIQLAIDANNEISATVVAGSIGTVELADGSVTKAKLATALQEELNNKTDRLIVGTNGNALMFNESDGGGAKFEHKDGTWSYVGVNDGGMSDITAQIYSVNKDTKTGARINVTTEGMFYTNGKSNASYQAGDEIATKEYADSVASNAKLTQGTF